MREKCQYIIKEINQPSDKAIQHFHKEIFQPMQRITDVEEKIDVPILKTNNFTQSPCET